MSCADGTGSPAGGDASTSGGGGPGEREDPDAPAPSRRVPGPESSPGGDPDTTRRERIRAALREVIDPEVGLDVVTMGLVYGIDVEGPSVRIRHTLTTPGCPMEGVLKEGIADAARSVPGVDEVETEVVWEPRWHPGMIDDDAW